MSAVARCGTEGGYRRHLRLDDPPCYPCCDAHALQRAYERARGRLNQPPADPPLYRRARLGLEPAEVLQTSDRRRLVLELHAAGWPDAEIAAHTRMTGYTTTRIREELGLLPNVAPAIRGAA